MWFIPSNDRARWELSINVLHECPSYPSYPSHPSLRGIWWLEVAEIGVRKSVWGNWETRLSRRLKWVENSFIVTSRVFFFCSFLSANCCSSIRILEVKNGNGGFAQSDSEDQICTFQHTSVPYSGWVGSPQLKFLSPAKNTFFVVFGGLESPLIRTI